MLWFLGNIVFSLAIYRYILGHYEYPKPYEEITGNETISTSASGQVTVANDMTEILEWSTLIFGSVTFLSATVSYLIYKALKNP
jgi:hypothetical protein